MKKNITVPVSITASTDGMGSWTSERRPMKIHKIRFKPYIYTENGVGSIYVDASFYVKDWDTDRHGLVYTDEKWLREFRKAFYAKFPAMKGIDPRIDYTEQGMQGRNYVSLQMWVSKGRMSRFRNFLQDSGVQAELLD